jgi:hypothetical protein
MPRRRLLLFALPAMLVLVGVVWVAFWLAKPRTAITRENAARIQEGMTLAEVETMLGGPPTGQPTRPWVTSPGPTGWKSQRHSDEDSWL